MACAWPWRRSSGGSSGPAPVPAPAPPSSHRPSPLILIPGICGTQLAVRPAGAGNEDDGERCWVKLRSADASFQRLWGRYSQDSGRVELLAEGQEACVPTGGDPSGLYPISLLDPEAAFAVADLRYLEPLSTWLQGQGYSPGVSLFGAGYDFRQSTRQSAKALLARLQEVSRRCGGARVDLLTHSLGGLVVRSLLADFPAEFEALVGRWVALGCPFGGAPGYTLDALLTGVQFGGSLGDLFFVKRESFLQAALQAPSIFELLPPLDFPWKKPPPQLTLWLKQPIAPPSAGSGSSSQPPTRPPTAEAAVAAGERLACVSHQSFTVHWPQQAAAAADGQAAAPLPPRISRAASCSGGGGCAGGGGGGTGGAGGTIQVGAEQYVFDLAHLPGLLTRLLKDNAVTVDGTTHRLPFRPELWALGQATHAAWSAARLPKRCAFYNLHGAGIPTPYDTQYGAWWWPLQDLAAVPHADASFTHVDGDGTVPAESATAHGLEATASAAVDVPHRGLVASKAVWEQVLTWLREPLLEPGRAAAPCVVPQQQPPPFLPPACAARWAAAPAAPAEALQADVCLTTPLLAGQAGGELYAVGGSEDGDEPEEACNPLVWWALL